MLSRKNIRNFLKQDYGPGFYKLKRPAHFFLWGAEYLPGLSSRRNFSLNYANNPAAMQQSYFLRDCCVFVLDAH